MTRASALSRWIGACFGLGVLLVSISAAAEDTPDVTQIVSFVRWSGVLLSLGLIAAVSIVMRFIRGTVDRLAARFSHRRLTLQKFESIARFILYIVTGVLVIAFSFQINETVLALVGGTLAVAVGFAMRDLVAAMIAGVTIMLDRPFQVGDRVMLGGEYGDVTEIGLRSIRIQTLDDNTVTVPNNKVLTDVTSSGNYGALDMQVAVDVFVGVDQDIALAKRILKEAVLTSEYVYLKKAVVVLVKQVIKEDYVAVQLKARGYVLDTRYEKAFESDVTQRTLEAFGEQGIAPPAVLHRPAPEPSAARVRR